MGRAALSDALFFDILGFEAPPTEIRLFKLGENESEKGTFVFDEEAARMVLDAFEQKGQDRLGIDYEHQSLSTPPVEAPAAGWFVPRVINGELFASDIKWTAKAFDRIAAKEYRFFSPAFEFDPETGRVTRLINFALTNSPALNELPGLVAASSNFDGGRDPMDYEKLYNELKAQSDRQAAELKAAMEQLAELKKKVKAQDDEDEEELKRLRSLSDDIRKSLGVDSDDAAVGAIKALSEAKARAEQAEAKLAEVQDKEVTAELEAQFAEFKDRQGPDAEAKLRAAYEPILKTDKKRALAQLKTQVEFTPKATAPGRHDAPKPGKTTASEGARRLAKLHNIPDDLIEKAARGEFNEGAA